MANIANPGPGPEPDTRPRAFANRHRKGPGTSPWRGARGAAPLVLLLLATPALADDVEHGRALAERMCATCHMNPGQGEKSAASSVPGFTAVANRPDQSFEGIVAWLRSIPPMMPNHRLSSGEMEALASFILSLRIPDAIVPQPAG